MDSVKAFNGDLKHNGQEFWIGGRASLANLFINATIDEVRVYKRALSDAEIKQNFGANGLAVEPDGKLATAWGLLKLDR